MIFLFLFLLVKISFFTKNILIIVMHFLMLYSLFCNYGLCIMKA